MSGDTWVHGLLDGDARAALERLARYLGFTGPAPADALTRAALGLPDDLDSVGLSAGPGTTRLLTAVVRAGTAREATVRLAARLARRAPHHLWLVAISVEACGELVVAAWPAGGHSPRVSALVAARRRLRASDIDTLLAVRDAMHGPDLLVHQRWVEILGREAISRRFFLALREVVEALAAGASGTGDAVTRRDLAVLHVSRLLFLAFLEARGWLNDDPRFLAGLFERCTGARASTPGERFHRLGLEPLFFGTLNTPPRRRAPHARAFGRIPFLNGGLFTRSALERRWRDVRFRDAEWGAALDRLFLRYRFTPGEEDTGWQEAAIDPEILGRAFESLMAGPVRRAAGVFYTPFTLVARVTDAAFAALLAERGLGEWADAIGGDGPLPEEAPPSLRALASDVQVLDPACGSGAFLIHAAERLARLRVAAGDSRPLPLVRRDVVARQIFGVDVSPTAVWLCELRLWLALVVDHPWLDAGSVPPLPNLDHNIRCGDTLAGGGLRDAHPGPPADVIRLRARYARATGPRKRTLARMVDRRERQHLLALLDAQIASVAARRRSLVSAAHGRDLFGARRGAVAGEADERRHLRALARDLRARRRQAAGNGALPFAFASHFPDAASRGGFDLVLGNPPWIRLHQLPAGQRERWRREFLVFREAAWGAGALAARAGSGFASQVDAASLFVERGHQLLRQDGVLALLVPSKLWRSLAGGGVRRLLMERSRLHAVEDWSQAPAMFEASAYPSVVVASGAVPCPEASVRCAVQRGRLAIGWRASASRLPLEESPGAPWLLLPPEARTAFDRIAEAGVPLATAGLGVATLGVKCGCNEAFVVRASASSGSQVEVRDEQGRTALIDRAFVRPLLRGESVRAWTAAATAEHLVYPCGPEGRVLGALPPELRSWLWPWRRRLLARADARGQRAWWSLFRLDGARPDRPRVVWSDLARSLQAMVLPAGDPTVPLNTCYVLAARDASDAYALAAWLNSPIADAWVGALAGIWLCGVGASASGYLARGHPIRSNFAISTLRRLQCQSQS